MKEVTIYTDGACSGNPGPGGWGAILAYKDTEKEISGGEAMTTNNRMELTAVIQALGLLKEPCAVTVYTDSQYISRAINEQWLKNWKAAGFTKKGGLKNAELWKELDEQLQRHTVNFQWVKGHADNKHNNRCDQLAVSEREKFV
jgi:ribonuclease HI